MRDLLAAARAGGVPVIWTQVKYDDMREAGLFYAKAKSLDVWKTGDERALAAWVEGLVPQDGESVVQKRYPSAFFGTCLGTDLRVSGRP
jgi:nicotinamidase-related amidase